LDGGRLRNRSWTDATIFKELFFVSCVQQAEHGLIALSQTYLSAEFPPAGFGYESVKVVAKATTS